MNKKQLLVTSILLGLAAIVYFFERKSILAVWVSILSLPLSVLLAKLAAILGPLTIIGGFIIMVITFMIKWREWKRGERKHKPKFKHIFKNTGKEINE